MHHRTNLKSSTRIFTCVLLMLATTVPGAFAGPGLPPGCGFSPWIFAGWWAFDETSGVVALDMVNGHNGTYIDQPLPMPGEVLGALSFDGVDDSVVVNDAPRLQLGTGDFTIDFWILTVQNSGIGVVLNKGGVGAGFAGYHVFLSDGVVGLHLADGDFTNFFGPFAADGSWHHVAVTVDRDSSTGLRWYLDGAAFGAPQDPTVRAGSLANAIQLYFGSYLRVNFFFDGAIDELKILDDRVLTASEIGWFHNCELQR